MISQRSRYEKFFCISAAALYCVVAILAISKGRFAGQDFTTHFEKIVNFNFNNIMRGTNPPLLYLIGNIIYNYISQEYFLIILSAGLVFSNLLSLFIIYKLLPELIRSTYLRVSAFLLLTFMPVRIIHSAIIAPDSLTVLIFLIICLLVMRLNNPKYRSQEGKLWYIVFFVLIIGLSLKYTFLGLLAALLVIFILRFRINKSFSSLGHFAAGFFLTSSFIFFLIYKNYTLDGMIAVGHWREVGYPSEINYYELIFPIKKDINLFDVPQFIVNEEMTHSTSHSYPALSYMAIFSDPWNFFQGLIITQPLLKATHLPSRSYRRSRLSQVSVNILSIIALPLFLMTYVIFIFFLYNLLMHINKSIPEIGNGGIIFLCSLGFLLPIILNLPNVKFMYNWGFWTPRLILPSVVGFTLCMFIYLEHLSSKFKRPDFFINIIFVYSCMVSLCSLLIFI